MAKEDWTSDVAQEAFQNITDAFTALDGGIKFTKFMIAMQELDRRAENVQTSDDYASGQLVDVMIRFSKLIDLTTKS